MDWISNDHEILKTCCPIDVSDGACPIIILGTRGCGNDLLSYLNSSKYMAVLPYITGIMGVIQVCKIFFPYFLNLFGQLHIHDNIKQRMLTILS